MKDLKIGYLILLREGEWLPLKDNHAPESELRAFSTKIDKLAIKAHLHPILNVESIGSISSRECSYPVKCSPQT